MLNHRQWIKPRTDKLCKTSYHSLIIMMLTLLVLAACQPVQPLSERAPSDGQGAIETGLAPVNGAELYYERKGEGPAVIFVHGYTEDHRMWDDQFDELARHYQAIRSDWRGHGHSSAITAPFAPSEDLLALMDYFDIKQAHLVGHSMGGAIVTQFAIAFPARVRSLTLIDGLVPDDPAPTELLPRLLQAIEIASSADLSTGLQQWISDPLFASGNGLPTVKAALTTMVVDGQTALGEGAAFVNLQNIELAPVYEQLGAIRVPTLVIIGETDLAEFHAMAQSLRTRIPNAQAVTIAGAGHLPPMEKPAEVTTALLEFLATATAVPGVTNYEIILGAHVPLIDPLAGFSEIGWATKAYFDYTNATQGGVIYKVVHRLVKQ